jgi:hypothetical protein
MSKIPLLTLMAVKINLWQCLDEPLRAQHINSSREQASLSNKATFSQLQTPNEIANVTMQRFSSILQVFKIAGITVKVQHRTRPLDYKLGCVRIATNPNEMKLDNLRHD